MRNKIGSVAPVVSLAFAIFALFCAPGCGLVSKSAVCVDTDGNGIYDLCIPVDDFNVLLDRGKAKVQFADQRVEDQARGRFPGHSP